MWNFLPLLSVHISPGFPPFLDALFKSVEVYMNQKLVTSASTLYPYKAMIDTLLNTSKDMKESGQLDCQLFAKDTPFYMEKADPWNGELLLFLKKSLTFLSLLKLLDLEAPLCKRFKDLNYFLFMYISRVQ